MTIQMTEASYINTGSDLFNENKLREAACIWESGLIYFPNSAALWNNLSIALTQLRDYERAVSVVKQAVAIIGDASSYNNLGTLCMKLGLVQEAENAYTQAISLNPGMCNALNNLALLCIENRDFRRAESLYRRSCMIDPAKFDYYKFAELYLMEGDYKRGFEYYEHRLSSNTTPLQTTRKRLDQLPERRWDGKSRVEKLVLINEQGFGDSLMMLRYVARLKEFSDNVLVFCHSSLVRLYEVLGLRCTTEFGDTLDCDAYVCTMSLPYVFCIDSLEKVDGSTYLTLPDVSVQVPRVRPTIGVCWSGNPDNANDSIRSLALDKLAPLFAQTEFEFASLTLGNAGGFARNIEHCKDFYDTAAFIQSNIEVVITVDTAIAHLAGALGKPCILLNRYTSEWRWGVGKTDCAWYDNTVVFTQPERGAWEPVVFQAILALRNLYNLNA